MDQKGFFSVKKELRKKVSILTLPQCHPNLVKHLVNPNMLSVIREDESLHKKPALQVDGIQ